jgi:ArsR family transcriptional regulator
MKLSPDSFTRALSDSTRLRLLVLLQNRIELCVCDLTEALTLPQPKISRHLSILRAAGLLQDRRSGLWIHYKIHPDTPAWALDALAAIARGCADEPPFAQDRERLSGRAPRLAGTCR